MHVKVIILCISDQLLLLNIIEFWWKIYVYRENNIKTKFK